MSLIDNNDQRGNLRESYDKYAQERDASAMQAWKIQVRAEFLAHLQQEGKRTLLEIGAGPGRDSLFFRQQGLDTVSIDLSPAMVMLCREKGLTAFVMDVADMIFPDASFDAIYAMNSLLHLTKAELPAVLQKMSALLTPGGLVFLGVYGGFDHEGIWEQDHYEPHRFFSFFTDEHIEAEVSRVFDVVSFKRVIVDPDDALHFQAFIMRKKNT